jgi:sortase A
MIWSASTLNDRNQPSRAEYIAHAIKKIFIITCLMTGGYLISNSFLIHTKAILAQYLIAHAWQQTINTGNIIKPWPWADTWPTNRLQIDNHNIDLYVLEGLQGSALAFGPGSLTTADNTKIIAGHRDTHFKFIENIIVGDSLTVTDSLGYIKHYRVDDLSIEDSNQQQLSIDDNSEQLILITCYPFNAINAGGSLRYVVRATVNNH